METNPSQVSSSPAQILAAVLRILNPQVLLVEATTRGAPRGNEVVWCGAYRYDPTSRDDLARVVAMLTPEQRERFDHAMCEPSTYKAHYPAPHRVLTTDTKTILAALVSATQAAAGARA